MNGLDLIRWTQVFFESKDVRLELQPKFVFRARNFFSLDINTRKELTEVGIDANHVLEMVKDGNKFKDFFKRFDYDYKAYAN